MSYTNNGMLATLKDAENNLTTCEYDGFDRLSKTRHPVPTKGANASSTTDYEQLGYDSNSNVISFRPRDGLSRVFTYDNLNRVTLKNLPGTEPDVSYAYDLLDRPTSASQTGSALSFGWDALSRKTSETGPHGTMASQYDSAGRRTRLTWPDAFFVDYDYLVTGELLKVRENGATSGLGLLATYGYDNLGNRMSIARGNGASTSYGYDAISRLTSLTHDLSGTVHDYAATFAYNAAHQIKSLTQSNDAYAWTGHGSGSTAYISNGLNQLTSIGGAAVAYDSKGNLIADPVTGKSYGYSSENLLTSASGGGGASVSLSYDPLMRLVRTAGADPLGYQHDGADLVGEWYNDPQWGSSLLFRFVPGASIDEPVAEYYIPQARRQWHHADERGSIVILSGDAGGMQAWPRFDEYGRVQHAYGLYGYTGQVSLLYAGLPELLYYKARIYAPHLGRFLQTDPLGPVDGPNLYAYVLNDPINLVDPLWLRGYVTSGSKGSVIITGCRQNPGGDPSRQPAGLGSGGSGERSERGGGKGKVKELKQCPTDRNIVAAIDMGIFVGYGAGFTVGFNYDAATGSLTAFASARVGTGLGWIAGAGVGASTSGPVQGVSTVSNYALGVGSLGASYSQGVAGNAIAGGISRGPRLGAEFSNTQTRTKTKSVIKPHIRC